MIGAENNVEPQLIVALPPAEDEGSEQQPMPGPTHMSQYDR